MKNSRSGNGSWAFLVLLIVNKIKTAETMQVVDKVLKKSKFELW